MAELLSLPFMQRALIAGLALGALLPLFGVFVTLRRMAFFGDGIAHASLAGVAVGIIAGLNPFWTALLAGLVFGALVYFFERSPALASDVVIGILFTSGLALGVVLMSLRRGYQPELLSFLFGNILSITTRDLVTIGVFALLMGAVLLWRMRPLTLVALEKEVAWVSGIAVERLDFIFYLLLSLAVVLGVKLLGIILVSALLIIPPATAKLFAGSFRSLLAWSIAVGELTIVAGLAASFFLDLPSGATIILTGTVLFLFVFIAVSVSRVSRASA